MTRPQFLAFVKNPETLVVAKEFAAAKKLPEDYIFEGNIETACDKIMEGARSPEFLIVELNGKGHDKAFADLDKLANCCEPDTKVIVLGDIDELSFYKELITMGVSEYLLNPVKIHQLERATTPKAESQKEEPVRNKEDCRVISVVGTRGGVGASSVALGLAKIFSGKGYPTLILDFDPAFGVIPLLLDIEPNRGLVDALEKPERVDGLFLDRVTTKVNDSLSVIGAEHSLGEISHVNDKAGQVLMDLLRAKFAYVIVDLPSATSSARWLLQHSEDVVVTELTIPGLRDTMRIMDLIDNLHNKKVTLVANKIGINKKFETSVKDFESGLGRKIDFQIPFEAQIYGAGEAGAQEFKDSKFSKVIEQIAAKYSPGKDAETGAKSKKSGLFSKILKK